MVKQRENYYAICWSSGFTLDLDVQCKLIKYATGSYMDKNEWRPSVMERQEEQWGSCLTGSGGRDYYLLDVPQIAVKFWNIFGLEEGTEPAEIDNVTHDRIIDELYVILWLSHVVAPPSNIPTVFNGRNAFPDVSGVGESSEDSEEDLGYDADKSMELGSLDYSLDAGSMRDQPLGNEVDGEAMDDTGDKETMYERDQQGED